MTRWNKGPVRSPAPTKYGNEKSMGYDSKREAERARELHLLEKAGAITELREQVRFELIPALWQFADGSVIPIWTEAGVNRRSVFCEPITEEQAAHKGAKCVQRRCEYVADFVYKDGRGRLVVEDAKGYQTEVYKVKKKLMRYVHGIEIREV